MGNSQPLHSNGIKGAATTAKVEVQVQGLSAGHLRSINGKSAVASSIATTVSVPVQGLSDRVKLEVKQEVVDTAAIVQVQGSGERVKQEVVDTTVIVQVQGSGERVLREVKREVEDTTAIVLFQGLGERVKRKVVNTNQHREANIVGPNLHN